MARISSIIIIGLFIVLFVANFALRIVRLRDEGHGDADAVGHIFGSLETVLTLACSILSILANLTATGAIVYQAYKHRLLTSVNFNGAKTSSGRALVIVMESGLVYLGLQIVQTSFTFGFIRRQLTYCLSCCSPLSSHSCSAYQISVRHGSRPHTYERRARQNCQDRCGRAAR
ncbi:hypothetical protein BDV98DRAFT_252505 [Pterulicium gracile]|uniref:Uncharacterized protein n=1 Tax=Pterulicium gracile TaxID=1884261 RepID=A0A5C3QCG3_9AGAR|nr:hypothetical protein BDV98DRAFT_252505 [Pterula gracilis]